MRTGCWIGRTRAAAWVFAAAGTLGLTAGCSMSPAGDPPAPTGDAQVQPIPPLPGPLVEVMPPEWGTEPGLSLRLRETPGAGHSAGGDAPGGAIPSQPLDAAATAALLGRLAVPPGGVAEPFRLPAASRPAPRAGATVLLEFPPRDSLARPADDPAAAAGGAVVPGAGAALQVIRVVPTGEAGMAPFLTVTFSEPMVPLTTVGAVDGVRPPVRVSPAPPGQWSWIDVRTARFQPEPRFPMATRYTVEVPAGTRSATGAVLAVAVRAEFATAPPRALGAYPALDPDPAAGWPRRPGPGMPPPPPPPPGRGMVPPPGGAVPPSGDVAAADVAAADWRGGTGESVRLDPVVVIVFDQRIDAAAVARAARLEVNGRPRPVRRASAAELAADSVAARLVAAAEPGYALALRPAERLPVGADVRIRLPAGTPSAEGPRATERPQELRFRTHGALRVEWDGCMAGGGPCAPGEPWLARFSNPLDAQAWADTLVRVEPALDGMNLEIYGHELRIHGRSVPLTRYRVTFAAGIRDVFGQALGRPVTLTVEVGPAPAALVLGGGAMTVLDPAGPPRLLAYSRGYDELRVRAHRVTPDDWPAHVAALRRFREQGGGSFAPVGTQVIDARVPVGAVVDSWARTAIELAPALRDGLGHVVLVVEPVGGAAGADRPGRRDMQPAGAISWVQSTRIGMAAAVDDAELLGWATSLEDGSPLSGVTLRLLGPGTTGVTGGDGTAVLPLGAVPARALVAGRGGDNALLPEDEHGWGGDGWVRRADAGELRWLLFSDRGLYRPGETARVKGWLRHVPDGRGTTLALAAGVRDVAYRVGGPRGEDLVTGNAQPGVLGGFDFAVPLPDDANLGHAGIELHARGDRLPQRGERTWHGLQVQEFRRPDYEAAVTADPGPHIVGDTIAASLRAGYYGGGALPGARVEWRAVQRVGHFTPPGWDRWQFGRSPFRYGGGPTAPQQLEGVTDGAGVHAIAVDLLAVEPAFATSLRLEAQVHDVTRQVGSAGVDLLVHPARAYAGLRVERGWLRVGQAADVAVIAVDPDGAPIPGAAVEIGAERITWPAYQPARRPEPEIVASDVRCSVVAAAEPVTCSVAFAEPGQYRLVAEVRDGEGRPSRTELILWVAGDEGAPPRPGLEPGQAELVADRESYQPGDTARVLLQAPFYPAEGLLTVRVGGVVRTERFRAAAPGHELRVPITDAYLAGAWLRADLVSADGLNFAAAETRLEVPPLQRTLQVRVTPRDTLAAPGERTMIDVEVLDAAGRPAADAEVALWMVDEGVLATGGYALPDPIGAFYTPRMAGVRDHQARPWLVREPSVEDGRGGGAGLGMEVESAAAAAPPPPPTAPPAPGMARQALTVTGKAAGAEDVAVREDFAPLALFEPALRTGPDGRVTVPASLPGSLTRYRIMAVAVAGAARFGAGEATLTAGKQLMVRFAAPRFLNFGDRVELPVLVQNAAALPLDVEVAVRGFGVGFDGPAGRRITLPAGARAELRFDAAALSAGTASLQVIAAAGARTDAAAASLPVYSPASAEAFATYGELDTGAPVVLPLARPAGVIDSFGGLEVTLTSTALQALTDAVLFLHAYPFEGAEPIASRILAVAALRDVLGAFGAEGLPRADSLLDATERDVRNLVALQRGDGGWGFWRPDEPSHPFVTMHAAHALARARANGFAVPAAALELALRYLQGVDGALRAWPVEARDAGAAHALYVRHWLGDRSAAVAARTMVAAGVGGRGGVVMGNTPVAGLSTEAAGWLLYVLAGDPAAAAESAELRRVLIGRVVATAGTATFTEQYSEGAHLLLHSRRRTDAVVLEALIAADPSNDLIPRVVQGLLGARVRGRWAGPQENAWVLLALERYFRTYEATAPAYRAGVWLGERYAGGHEFAGRSTDRQHVSVPMADVLRIDAPDLLIAREGAGRLYYRAGLRYAPADLRPEPLERGFTVSRSYEAVDDSTDVRRDADGVWQVRAGARVRVRVTLVAPAVRHHVALADALPAGLEPLNPELQGGGFTDDPGFGPDPAPRGSRPAPPGPWRPSWFGHQNLRDDRAEAFATLLPAGVYDYTYLARATTPGTFIVPPPRAEMMYEPETFGRGAGDVVVVRAAPLPGGR